MLQDFRPARLALVVAVLLAASPVNAQSTEGSDEDFAQQIISPSPVARPISKNPDNVPNRLEEINQQDETLFPTARFDEATKPWYDFKQRLAEEYGLNLGFFYTTLYQATPVDVTDSLFSNFQTEAAAGVFGILGEWTLIGRGTQSPGSLRFQMQNRHRMGPVVPQSLGAEIGSLWPTAIGYNELVFSVTELYWSQFLVKDRFVLSFGKAIPFAYHDYFAYKSPFTGFLNASFTLNPTISYVSAGLAAGGGIRPTRDTYIAAAFYDANGKLNRAGFETFFGDAEYFTAVDVGWDPGYLDPSQKVSIGPLTIRDLHATFWHKANIKKTGSPEGWGITFFAEGEIGRFVPFLRYGFSEGTSLGNPAPLDYLVAGGVGLTDVFGQKNDLIGIGFSWGRSVLVPGGAAIPVDLDGDGIPDVDFADVARDEVRTDQYTSEFFYRIQLTKELQVTPNVQLIWDPILNTNDDFIPVFGIRGRAEW